MHIGGGRSISSCFQKQQYIKKSMTSHPKKHFQFCFQFLCEAYTVIITIPTLYDFMDERIWKTERAERKFLKQISQRYM